MGAGSGVLGRRMERHPDRETRWKPAPWLRAWDTKIRSNAKGPNGLAKQVQGLESGPALFFLPCADSRIFLGCADRAGRWARRQEVPGSAKPAGASRTPIVAAGPSQRSASCPQGFPPGEGN